MSASRGLLDTTVFIANESGRPLRDDLLPDEVAMSVVTLAELRAGVLAAKDVNTRSRRLANLEATSDIEVLPVDEPVAAVWAELRVHIAETGRRVNVNDLWIAATAIANRIPVFTQDADFDPLKDAAGFELVHV